MEPIMNRRISERKKENNDIMYARSIDRDYKGAIMCNIGPCGLCFLVNKPVEIGSDIYIKKVVYSTADTSQKNEGYHAEVVWCKEVRDIYDSYYGNYAVGVQFVDIFS